MFADITWTAYVGDPVPTKHQAVFDAVIGGRDAAVDAIEEAFAQGRTLQGWEVDAVARSPSLPQATETTSVTASGTAWAGRSTATRSTWTVGETGTLRPLIPYIAVTIEPGVYLPPFGVRSEIDVFITPTGPQYNHRTPARNRANPLALPFSPWPRLPTTSR